MKTKNSINSVMQSDISVHTYDQVPEAASRVMLMASATKLLCLCSGQWHDAFLENHYSTCTIVLGCTGTKLIYKVRYFRKSLKWLGDKS